MNAEQKKTIRDNAGAIADLAKARLKDPRTTEPNTRYDLDQIIMLAHELTDMVNMPSTFGAWLIERHGVCLCYAASGPFWVTFTDSRAMRFPDKASADATITSLGLVEVTAVEHGWGI